MLIQKAHETYRAGGIGALVEKIKHYSMYKLLLLQRDVASKVVMLKHGRYITKDVNGTTMLLDLKDKGISRDIYFEGTREENAVKLVNKYVKRGDVVYDIGANIGYYTNIFSKLVGSSGVVHAFEPVNENFAMLKANTCTLRNVKTHKIGISDSSGRKTMYLADQSNWHSLSKTRSNNKKCVIRTKTIDELIKSGKEPPNFIKMDVEGHEYEILKGARKLLGSNTQLIIFMEVHPTHMGRNKTRHLLKTLQTNNFCLLCMVKDFNRILKRIGDDKKQFSYKSIEELLKSKDFLNGRQGCFECFFGRGL